MNAAHGPAADTTHSCPCGCGQPIPRNRLMCRSSWYKVPGHLRDQVWATWRSGAGAGTAAHAAAIQAAVDSLAGTR